MTYDEYFTALQAELKGELPTSKMENVGDMWAVSWTHPDYKDRHWIAFNPADCDPAMTAEMIREYRYTR